MLSPALPRNLAVGSLPIGWKEQLYPPAIHPDAGEVNPGLLKVLDTCRVEKTQGKGKKEKQKRKAILFPWKETCFQLPPP